jgi:REP element-mobilizing transposase RayT
VSRNPRDDFPGAWWHLTNRGIARRAVYETREDVERFYAALAAAIREGLLEVHAFSILTTHYHLLARSPVGDVSAAMQIVGNRFVRWFNRTRRRDGSLYRGRFTGRRIDDPDYWCTVLRYVDLNPVRAGMCAVPSDHPYGSAASYRHGGGPEWLTRTAVQSALAGHFAPHPVDPARYDDYACSCDSEANAFLVERLLDRPRMAPPPVRDLVRAASLRQQGWMEWKAALADAVAVGTAFLSPKASLRAARIVARMITREPLPATRADRGRDLAAGILRSASGLEITEIAQELSVAHTTAQRAIRRHELWMAESPRYAQLVARAIASTVRRTLPVPSRPSDLPMRVGCGASVVVVPPVAAVGTSLARSAAVRRWL